MNGWNSSSAIFLGRPHWCSLQFRADDDDRAGRVIDALAEQVLAEAALLALDHVGQRLQRAVRRAEHRPLAAVVVEQRVHRLLQHPLLVADDDLGRVEIDQLLEPVVAVDDAAIEVVQVAGGEVAAIEQHERPQVRRDDRDALQDHPLAACSLRVAQRLDDLQPLDEVALASAWTACPSCVSLSSWSRSSSRQVDEVELLQQLLDRLGPHVGLEGVAVLLAGLAVLVFGEELLLLERRLARVDDDVVLEVDDLLQAGRLHVQQRAEAAAAWP